MWTLFIIGAVLSTLLVAVGAHPCSCFSFGYFLRDYFTCFSVRWGARRNHLCLMESQVFSVVLEGQKIHEHPKTPLFPVVCFVLTCSLWTNKQELLVVCMLVSCVLQLFSSALLSDGENWACQGWWSCQNMLSGHIQCLPISWTINPDLSNHKCIKEGCGWRTERGKCSEKWWNLSRMERDQTSYLRTL